jgi:hypothetical protein
MATFRAVSGQCRDCRDPQIRLKYDTAFVSLDVGAASVDQQPVLTSTGLLHPLQLLFWCPQTVASLIDQIAFHNTHDLAHAFVTTPCTTF